MTKALIADREEKAIIKPKRIGLLGGSFNPAHEGHLAISLEALKQLDLDEVWWLINPCNPFKKPEDMLPVNVRADVANNLVKNHKIKVTAIEEELDTVYTYDTVRKLKSLYPTIAFFWLMGDDLLPELPKWENWEKLTDLMDIVVFTRAFKEKDLDDLPAVQFLKKKDKWYYININPISISSTQIRRNKHFQEEFKKNGAKERNH